MAAADVSPSRLEVARQEALREIDSRPEGDTGMVIEFNLRATILQPYTRDKETRITVKGYLPFVGKPFKMKGYDLGKYKDYTLLDFTSGMLVFGGVNIAEPGSLEVQPPK